MSIKVLLYWLPMIIIAFANATLRETLLIKYFTENRAHQLSTLTLTIFCGVYAWFIIPFILLQSSGQAILAGITWVLLTVAFEIILGRITHKSWSGILQDYNLFAGRTWILFLAFLSILPLLVYAFKRS